MNLISKTHKRFSEYLENPRVLEFPEEFLGPNYKEVLNFWMIIDELSEEQLRVVKERYRAFINENRSEWVKATDLAWGASKEVVGWNYAYHAGVAARDITNSCASLLATIELIGMHKILEVHQQPLTLFEMFIDQLS